MERPGFAECFPIIKSLRAVKVPLGWPRNLCRRGIRPEIDIPAPERRTLPAWTNVLTAAPAPHPHLCLRATEAFTNTGNSGPCGACREEQAMGHPRE